MQPPQGRIKSNSRDFFKIVYDMRHVVYSVIRNRPVTINNQQGYNSAARGTGFFVSPEVFITCHHVVNALEDPHQNGDNYSLVANMGANNTPRVVMVQNPVVGQNIHFFPNTDLAIIQVSREVGRPYASLNFNHIYEGEEIGVAGYPIGELKAVNGQQLSIDGLVYRIGRGPVGASYVANLSETIPNVSLVEVNFLFVPGNSGGPIFRANTGEVVGFVHGYHDANIRERVVTTKPNTVLPATVSNQYVEHIHAIYSLAIKLNSIRTTL